MLDFAASYACGKIFFHYFTVNLSKELRRAPQARFFSLLRHQCSQNAAAELLLPLRRCSDHSVVTLVGKPGFHLIIIPTSGHEAKTRRLTIILQGGCTKSNSKYDVARGMRSVHKHLLGCGSEAISMGWGERRKWNLPYGWQRMTNRGIAGRRRARRKRLKRYCPRQLTSSSALAPGMLTEHFC